MENRRDTKKRALTRSGIHLRLGFIISLSLVIVAFQWKVEEKEYQQLPSSDEPVFLWDSVPRNVTEKPPEDIPEDDLKVTKDPIIVEGDSATKKHVVFVDTSSTNNPFDSVVVVIPTGGDTKVKVDKPHRIVEVYPEFPGGEPAFLNYMAKAAELPWRLRDIIEEETVYVEFVVGVDGHVSDINIQRSAFDALSESVTKALSNCPRWKPGKMNGRAVPVYYNTKVTFRTTY